MFSVRLTCARIAASLVGWLCRTMGVGSGAVLPGRIGLMIEPNVLALTRRKIKRQTIVITGTNGKSTTSYYLTQALRGMGYTVATNQTGANMLSGIASLCLTIERPVDYAVLEVDEASLPRITQQLRPDYVVALNFSRDQMDRYTEIDSLLRKIKTAITASQSTLIYNTGNPYTAELGHTYKKSLGYLALYKRQHREMDRPICWRCSQGLISISLDADSQVLACSSCEALPLQPQLTSSYNAGLLRIYGRALGCPNPELAETLTATALICQQLGMSEEKIIQALERTPPLPAHEQLFRLGSGAVVKLILAKNPDSFNRQLHRWQQSLHTHLAIAVNRNCADGQDTSWLWDVNFEQLAELNTIILALGQAAYDLSLRLRVAGLTALPLPHVVDLPQFLTHSNTSTVIIANYTAYQELSYLLTNLRRYSQNEAVETARVPEYSS